MSVSRVLPATWLPPGRKVHRIILHWTAGGYKPNAIDRAHYHFLIDGDGQALRGPVGPGYYLPHTRRMNTGSVGLAICAMRGAVEGKSYGPSPLTRLQLERACQAIAEICYTYRLPVTERTVLCHSEVERVYGVVQRGKWDVDVLPFQSPKEPPAAVHARIRRMVQWYLGRRLLEAP